MTVKELIEKLSEFGMDDSVVVINFIKGGNGEPLLVERVPTVDGFNPSKYGGTDRGQVWIK
jgi:hypothetical protein